MAYFSKRQAGIIPVLIALGIAVASIFGIILLRNNPSVMSSQAAAAYVDKIIELKPTEDSYVSKSAPTTNYGNKTTLSTGGNTTQISYLKFDTSSVLGKDITALHLKLNVTDTSSGSQALYFVINNGWKETSVNWNNKPDLTRAITTFNAKSTGEVDLDLTPLFGSAKLVFSKVSIGISSTSNDALAFSSREGVSSPLILVTYRELVQSTASPTPTQTATSTPAGTQTKPSPSGSPKTGSTQMPGMGSGDISGIDTNDGATGNAFALGVWHPWVSKVTGKVVDTCSEATHNSYYVVGPDGKRYPTWHPAVDKSGCTFGHEHGLEPAKFADWARLKKFYAYDGVDGCPKDGVISDCEINAKHTGIPFGYVNEAYEIYSASHGLSIMRHEDHYGHKVKYMNNEIIDQGNVAGAGGVNDRYDTGVRCNFFGKIHMGVTTKDAFSNNMHEIIEYMHCTDGIEYSIAKFGKFGAPGEFLASCTGTQFENRDNCGPNVIKTGFSNSNTSYPGKCSDGNRSILTKACLSELMFVSSDKFSGNLYESWNTTTGLKDSTGKTIVQTDMTIDVNDSIRNYDTTKTDNVSYNVDICDDPSPVAGKTIRGGFCDRVTNYHRDPVPSWDDPKALTGTNRGMYFSHVWSVANAGKSAYKLSDPFGENAVDTSENATVPAGYIRQYVSAVNFQWNNLYKGTLMPNNTNIQHDTGGGTVHAPN